MPPLLHFMYRYGTVFHRTDKYDSRLKDHQPHRLAIKDLLMTSISATSRFLN
ncbi:hypothetical protein PO124_10935 [Bacillus licheniformis]|nr:hypothetical protein [Bacillus licheniformis]